MCGVVPFSLPFPDDLGYRVSLNMLSSSLVIEAKVFGSFFFLTSLTLILEFERLFAYFG